ncbi:hypothetical protein QTN25_007821 [Entamoeba marina]
MQDHKKSHNAKKLDSYSLLIVSKFLKKEQDYINVICVCKKFKKTTKKLRFNPIPIKSLKLFPNIQTQYLFKESDTKIEGIDNYKVLYAVDYDHYLQFKQSNIKYSDIIFTENNFCDVNNNQREGLLDIPTCITIIGKEAFYRQAVKLITIPTKIGSIGDSCFAYCNKLTKINLPPTLTSIGIDCFRGCNSLSSIDFPSFLSSIGDSCFRGCDKITSIDLPDTLTFIDNYCFMGLYSLTSIILPSNLSKLGNCSSLTSINLPSLITSLGDKCFIGCKSLTSINLPNTLYSIGDECFSFCNSITSIEFSSKLTLLPDGCFNSCKSLTSINLPSKLISIGNECFRDCNSITSIELPSTLTSFGDKCFMGCNSLSPDSLKKFDSIFKANSKSTENDEKKIFTKSDFNNEIDVNNQSLKTYTIPDFNTILGKEAFYQQAIISITIPTSISTISDSCFRSCDKLTTINFSSTITSLSNDCFRGCSSLSSIAFPSFLSSIGDSCFRGCKSLKSIELPSTLTLIGDYCFNGCNSLSLVVLPSSLSTLGNQCFSSCNKLTSIELPSTLTSLGNECFRSCNSLTMINLPSSIISLGEKCFSNCGLVEITIPDSVTKIGNNVIFNCTSLTKMILPNENEVIVNKLKDSECTYYKRYGIHSSTIHNLKYYELFNLIFDLIFNKRRINDNPNYEILYDSDDSDKFSRAEFLKSILDKEGTYFISRDDKDNANVYGGFLKEKLTKEHLNKDIDINDDDSFVFSIAKNGIKNFKNYYVKECCYGNCTFNSYEVKEGDDKDEGALYSFGDDIYVYPIGVELSYCEQNLYEYNHERDALVKNGRGNQFKVTRIIVTKKYYYKKVTNLLIIIALFKTKH